MSIDALNLKLNTASVSSPCITPLDRISELYDWEQLLGLMMPRPEMIMNDLGCEFGGWMGEENNLFGWGWEAAAYEQAAVWRNEELYN